MSPDFEKLLASYDYEVPPEAIAQAPATPRDSAKLLVYDRATGTVHIDTFHNIGTYLPPYSLLVLNNTKVIPARLRLQREGGGVVAILYVHTEGDSVTVLANKKLLPGSALRLNDTVVFTITGQHERFYRLKPHFPIASLPDFLEEWGEMPLPPYIKHSPLSRQQLRTEYQTVFAEHRGSVAAPTASLHFTPELLTSLQTKGIAVAYLTLHVNLGTFAPVTSVQLAQQQLHEEFFSIDEASADLINQAKEQGQPIIPVGTTVLRALESAADQYNKVTAGSSTTRLFIQPGYQFKVADRLITNFHVPRSSLLMLVAALVGREKLFELYRTARTNNFRFFSFGDAMLIK